MSLQLLERDSEGAMVNKIFYFSVSDPEVAAKLNEIPLDKPVRLDYIQYKFRGYCYGSSEYDVTNVTRIEK